MFKKKILIFLLILILIIPTISADFPEVHIGKILTALNDKSWSSPLKEKILRHQDVCLSALLGIDASVIYYLTEEGRNKIYGGTHSIKWLDECNRLAGSDEAKQVYCLCGGMHLVQDPSSHGYQEDEGYTSLCVKKYFSTNIFLHSICERSVVNNYLEELPFEYTPPKDEIRLKTCDSYDPLIVGDEEISQNDVQAGRCTNEYVKLLSDSAGVNLCQAVHIVGANLKMMCVENRESGSGYTDLYRSKIEAPTSWKWIALFGFIFIFMIILTNLIVGKTWWKYIVVLFLIPLLLISGAGIYYGMINVKQFYHDYNFLMLDPLTNFINVPDWKDRVQKSIQDTKDYLSNPNYEIPKSASGLDHYEDGKLVKGPLDKAEIFGKIIWWTLVTIFVSSFIFIEYKTFKRKKKARVI